MICYVRDIQVFRSFAVVDVQESVTVIPNMNDVTSQSRLASRQVTKL